MSKLQKPMTNSLLIALFFFVTNLLAQNEVKLILNEDVVLTSGLKSKLTQEGKGVKAKKGDKVKIVYLREGEKRETELTF